MFRITPPQFTIRYFAVTAVTLGHGDRFRIGRVVYGNRAVSAEDVLVPQADGDGGGFAFDLKFKDYEIAMKLARETRTPVPLSGLCFEFYEAARGFLEPGCSATAIVRWMEHVAGTELTPGATPDA